MTVLYGRKKSLASFVRKHQIRASVMKVKARADDFMDEPSAKMTHWLIAVFVESRSAGFFFSTGSAIKRKPTAKDLLRCLAWDARDSENYSTPGEFAGEMGYTDLDKAVDTFESVKRNGRRLRKLLGHSELLNEVEHDD